MELTVIDIKQRIATLAGTNRRLATEVDSRRRAATVFQRERDELLREVDYADGQMHSARNELAQDRRKYEELLGEREAQIRDLDAARRQLIRELNEARWQQVDAKDRLESLAGERHNPAVRQGTQRTSTRECEWACPKALRYWPIV